MKKARGLDRRNCDSVANWDSKPAKGLLDRRHTVERRRPFVTDGCIDEFETLVKFSRLRKEANPGQIATWPELVPA